MMARKLLVFVQFCF